MKLPAGQPPPIVSSGDGPASTTSTATVASAQMAKDAQLQKLINTWVKIESSQLLSPEESHQALESMQGKIRVNGQALTQSSKPQVTPPQEPIPAKPTAKAIDPNVLLKVPHKPSPVSNPNTATQPSSAANQQLALLTLSTQQGTISILSTQLYDKGSQLLIQQSAEGQWQFQTPSKLLALSAINHQYNELKAVASALKLSALESSLANTLSNQGSNGTTAITPPKSLLDATQVLDVKLIKQAIEQSGQFLEQRLLKASGDNSPQNKPPVTIDLNQRLKQVETQIQKWIDALPIKLNKANASSNSNQMKNHTPPPMQEAKSSHIHSFSASQDSINPKNIKGSGDGLKIPIAANESVITKQVPSPVDNKAWLIKLQLQLFKDWQASSVNTSTAKDTLLNNQALPNTYSHLQNSLSQNIKSVSNLQPPPAVKPLINWFEGMAQQSQSNSSFHDTKTSNLLEWLLAPKAALTDKALPIWPNNLSAQVQVHKLLQNLILQQPQASETQEGPEKILRQLLQVSQSLTRIQHEQVNNRLSMQNQPDNINLNFSVPYMHQQNINWCDLELTQQDSENSQKKQSLGWHLVLRFAQDTEETFAIESYLNSDQLQLTLWAKQQEPLAKLHRHAGMLREKLTQAGFKVDSIQSKQGLPVKSQQQVHQSMVDVHT